MSLPVLAQVPAILLPLVNRAQQSFRDAVAALDDEHGLGAWTEQRWDDFARVGAASDFVIEQSLRDPLMLLQLVQSGELDRGFAPGELCAQIAAAVQQAETEDELGRVLRRQRTRHQVRIIWRDLTRQADLVQTCRDLSDMADASIDQAYQWLYLRHCQQFGTPTGRRSGEPQQMVILGMGKLGAVELNLSSDIDLIFAYPDAWPRVRPPNAWPASWAKRSAKPSAIASASTARSGPLRVSKWSPKASSPAACRTTRRWKAWAC